MRNNTNNIISLQTRKSSNEVTNLHLNLVYGEFPCVVLKGLPFDCTLDDINQFLGKVKPIDIVPVYSKEGKLMHALALFGNLDDVDLACTKHKNLMGSRYIEIFKIRREDYYFAVHVQESRRWSKINKRQRWNTKKVPTPVVKLSNLPFEASYEDIINFFSGKTIHTNPFVNTYMS
jgi:hypothetical protein